MNYKKVITGFGIIAIALTLIPLIPSDYWWIRMFDFLLIQLTALTFIALLVYYIKLDFKQPKDYWFMAILIGCFIFQFSKLIPYTPFHKKEVGDASSDELSSIKILTANVLQKNENDTGLISMLPLENTYGILLYSKFELVDPEVKFMVTDTIPSIHTKMMLPSGDITQLYAFHPTPPMPQENPLSTDRDAELMMTSQLVRESEFPVIVIGDFNDISWSSTTRLFKATSELLDVRVGRGFYCTFNAKEYLLRWPLDHVFCSPEFRLVEMKNCASIESDHFPYYVEFSYEPKRAGEQLPEPVTDDELERAQKQLDKLKEKQEKSHQS